MALPPVAPPAAPNNTPPVLGIGSTGGQATQLTWSFLRGGLTSLVQYFDTSSLRMAQVSAVTIDNSQNNVAFTLQLGAPLNIPIFCPAYSVNTQNLPVPAGQTNITCMGAIPYTAHATVVVTFLSAAQSATGVTTTGAIGAQSTGANYGIMPPEGPASYTFLFPFAASNMAVVALDLSTTPLSMVQSIYIDGSNTFFNQTRAQPLVFQVNSDTPYVIPPMASGLFPCYFRGQTANLSLSWFTGSAMTINVPATLYNVAFQPFINSASTQRPPMGSVRNFATFTVNFTTPTALLPPNPLRTEVWIMPDSFALGTETLNIGCGNPVSDANQTIFSLTKSATYPIKLSQSDGSCPKGSVYLWTSAGGSIITTISEINVVGA